MRDVFAYAIWLLVEPTSEADEVACLRQTLEPAATAIGRSRSTP